jgi:hypothetical protein
MYQIAIGCGQQPSLIEASGELVGALTSTPIRYATGPRRLQVGTQPAPFNLVATE